MSRKTALSVLMTLGFAAALSATVIPIGRSRNGYPLSEREARDGRDGWYCLASEAERVDALYVADVEDLRRSLAFER